MEKGIALVYLLLSFMLLSATGCEIISPRTKQAQEAIKTNKILERIAVAIEECNYDQADE